MTSTLETGLGGFVGRADPECLHHFSPKEVRYLEIQACVRRQLQLL